jgi:hypothetical protein
MRPRITTLTTVLAVLFLAAPLAGEAQQAGKVYRIGLFHAGLDHVPPSLDPLREGLKALGYDSGTVPVSMVSSVRHAHELLGKGGVAGKIAFVGNGSSLESGAA